MHVSILLMAVAVATAQRLKLDWYDDRNCQKSLYPCRYTWPDGPWQALDLSLYLEGNFGYNAPMLPGGFFESIAFTEGNGYLPLIFNDSTTVMDEQLSLFDPWSGPMGYAIESNYLYNATLLSRRVSTAAMVTEARNIRSPNGTTYTPRFHILGLGVLREDHYLSYYRTDEETKPLSILEQFKERGLIASKTFGLHMGSARLDQMGSLVLGGYEQNRALGAVGVFDSSNSENDNLGFLVDLTLGVETGGSPFQKDVKLGSVWKGNDGDQNAERYTKYLGGARGSAVVFINPINAYINLPKGNCESVAESLPVTWREDLQLYIWNTQDPSFERIVGSPAYLGFTLADSSAKNITIKIPFKLLNLTLDTPFVDTPTSYFPCRSAEFSYGTLGRAFLQGAFFGMNYEKNLMYIAQAPGPDMEQSVEKTHEVDDTSITTNPAESFEKTWRSVWKVIEDGDEKGSHEEETGKGEKGSHEEETGKGETETTSHPRRLSTGAIAGLVVGGVSIIAILFITFLCWRRRQRQIQRRPTAMNEFVQERGLSEVAKSEHPQELCSVTKPQEAPGVEPYHEMDGTGHTEK